MCFLRVRNRVGAGGAANIARAWPPVATQVLFEGLDLTDYDLEDDDELVLTVSLAVDDPVQMMVPSPLAKAVFPPQVYFEEVSRGTARAMFRCRRASCASTRPPSCFAHALACCASAHPQPCFAHAVSLAARLVDLLTPRARLATCA